MSCSRNVLQAGMTRAYRKAPAAPKTGYINARVLTEGLVLPAGKAVALTPGGQHLMLQGLKQPLKAGDIVTVTLVFEGADKKRETLEFKAPVRALGAVPSEHKH